MRWKAFDGALNSDILIDFLRRLIKDACKKIYLILDNLRVHHSKPVKACRAQAGDRGVLSAQLQLGTEPERDGQC